MRKCDYKAVILVFGPAVLLAFFVAMLVSCGCSSWTFTKETVKADGSYEKLVAKQEQCLTAREMKDVEILIDDAALLTVGSSSMNSHEITLLAKELAPALAGLIERAIMKGTVLP